MSYVSFFIFPPQKREGGGAHLVDNGPLERVNAPKQRHPHLLSRLKPLRTRRRRVHGTRAVAPAARGGEAARRRGRRIVRGSKGARVGAGAAPRARRRARLRDRARACCRLRRLGRGETHAHRADAGGEGDENAGRPRREAKQPLAAVRAAPFSSEFNNALFLLFLWPRLPSVATPLSRTFPLLPLPLTQEPRGGGGARWRRRGVAGGGAARAQPGAGRVALHSRGGSDSWGPYRGLS